MRVKTGFVRRKKHKKILAQTKGFRLSRRSIVKKAKEAILHAGQHAYVDRRKKKRVFRSLWIERLNGALSSLGLNYSKFMADLKKNNISINRKILSEIATYDPKTFAQIVELSSSTPRSFSSLNLGVEDLGEVGVERAKEWKKMVKWLNG